MNQYLLLNRIKVQNANAIAGFTWGFPAITHFLGFVHNLSLKLKNTEFQDIQLQGCAVIAHEHQVHTYGSSYERQFIQSRNPAYLKDDVKKVQKGKSPSIIEEGKMNMTVSLLIECQGNIGNRDTGFKQWLKNACLIQRLASGTILEIGGIDFHGITEQEGIRAIRHKLLPGFVLMDRSAYLEQHYQTLQQENPDAELLDAWLDFVALKQKARPKSQRITQHFASQVQQHPDNTEYQQLLAVWEKHLEDPYQEDHVPDDIKEYFDAFEEIKENTKLLKQWQDYCAPTDKTEADWEYLPKPKAGFLVPIMVGYKAISEVYKNHEVANTRDSKTPVCFVEAVHSIGEWKSVHRLKNEADLTDCLWHYHHEPHWYLCQQKAGSETGDENAQCTIHENPDDDFS